MTKPKILVNIRNFQRRWRIDSLSISTFLSASWTTLKTDRKLPVLKTSQPTDSTAEVTVAFLNNRRMQCYNKAFRNKDYPTDVLSFPVNEEVEKTHYLGDILISLEKAASQAKDKNHTLEKETRILLIHGLLHLIGYDHETDTGQMDAIERQLRLKLIRSRSGSKFFHDIRTSGQVR